MPQPQTSIIIAIDDANSAGRALDYGLEMAEALKLPVRLVHVARSQKDHGSDVRRLNLEPALFTTLPTAAPPGPTSEAFRSVAGPHRTGEYASGPLGRETPQPQHLAAPRHGRVVNKAG